MPSSSRLSKNTSRASRVPRFPHQISEMEFGEISRLKEFVLRNGLRVLLLKDSRAPVISYQTWFQVGSRHEKRGKTGLAHLFEHLMFNQTKNLPAGQFDRLLEAAGGETNAATWVDWTFYYENLPSDKLELVVRLESERMANLVLHEPQVRSEKEVVANERRYRVEDDVQGQASEVLYATAFRKHPYRWPTIGWMRDIENFTLQDCREFYKRYYAPNNAIVVLVGDVQEQAALDLIQRCYGALRPSRIPSERRVVEPVQQKERTVKLSLPTATEKLQIGYRAPAFGTYDHAVLTVADEILFGGQSSRLHRALISDGEIAAEADSSLTPFHDPGLYEIWISLREKRHAVKAKRVFDAAIKQIQKFPVSTHELEKAKNRLELSFLQSLETVTGRAETIGFYTTVLGSPTLIFSRMEQFRKVTPEDLQSAAKRYLRPSQRTVITIHPRANTHA